MGSLFDTPVFNARLFFPRSDESEPPPGAEDLMIDVAGGAVLHARWHRRAGEAAPTLLLFHGNGEVVADYDDAAGRFADAGVNLAVVDFRGYGASTGTPTLRDAIEDARVVLAFFVGHVSGPLVIMGRSLGGACAAELYRDAAGDGRVIGFVWESCAVDLEGLIRRRGLVPPAELTEEERRVFDPLPKLRAGRAPMLILHGAEDDLVGPHEAQAAFDAAGAEAAQKELVLVPRRGHNDLSLDPAYWTALARFVARLR